MVIGHPDFAVVSRMMKVIRTNFRAVCDGGTNSSGDISMKELSTSSSVIVGRSKISY